MSPIKGSFSNDKSLDPANIRAMCEETTRDSVEAMKKEIAKRTPLDSGELRGSWATSPTTNPYPNHYKATVWTEVSYARIIEYGAAPHAIVPKNGKALAFGGDFYARVLHPGYEGAHMAARGAAYFEQTEAERIAKRNMRKYLR